MSARLNYVELTTASTTRASAFYEAAFGWSFTGFGPTYAATTAESTNVGLQADGGAGAPLPVIEVDDLEVALEAVRVAGGTIVQSIFAFPGGRRFEFTDPDGNRLAVAQSGD